MPLELNKDTKVTRDRDGVVRQLSHSTLYKAPTLDTIGAQADMAPTTPRTLAEQYLRDAAPVLGFATPEVANFAAAAENSAADVGVELRFKEEKTAGTGVTVAYDQTVYGLPIWNAGVSVRIDGRKMGVMGAHNAAHYNIAAHRPSRNAPYQPHSILPDTLCGLLGIPGRQESLTINGTRSLVYFYTSADRVDSQVESHRNRGESTGVSGPQGPEFPHLPLPPVTAAIEDGRHYVVTEVLFNYPYEGWGPLNWRVFIEPDSGSVLYLRALVSCAQGAIFTMDPVTATGMIHSAASPVAELDALRDTVALFGLNAVTPAGGPQQLNGEYVRLVNLEPPNTGMPSENPPYNFTYSCNTSHFAACNAYYHCDGFFRLLAGMGIDVNTYFNNTNFPVPVDPHARGGDVNAAAQGNIAGNGLGNLVFGVARSGSQVGIASDVRVVIHEFGHAVLWDHVDSPNFGFAHSPGDSLGAILYDPISKAPDKNETFPFMKVSAGLSRRHDREVSQGWGWFGSNWDTQYGGEQVLSTTLFRAYKAAGGWSPALAEKKFASRYMAYIILKAVSLLSFTTPEPDVFVSALTEADASTELFEGHPGGTLSKLFRWAFEQQGLYQANQNVPVTGPGLPPDIDVYIEDGRGGEYTYPIPDPTVEPDHTRSTEIWNRHQPDGVMSDEAPQPGVTNHAYVKVRNRGTQAATNVSVKGFQSRQPQPEVWPTDWKPLQAPVLQVNGEIPPGGSVLAGPFAWIPQNAADSLLFSVTAPGDRSNIEIVVAGPVLNRRLVTLDNNIGQKSF